MLRAEPSSTDNKTTVTNLVSMEFFDDDSIYIFPEEYKGLSHHDRLMALPVAALAKKDIGPRWSKRLFRITLPEDIAALYVDQEGNPVFLNRMLSAVDPSVFDAPSLASSTNSSVTVTPSAASSVRSLSSVVKDMVIPKFGGKNMLSNAEAWISRFERECIRLEIKPERFYEVLRLFLEETADKWYSTICLSTDSTSWEFWRTSFIDHFAQRGISTLRSAFSFRYIGGPMGEYVESKLNLLASFNPHMHDLDKIGHLILGLPKEFQDRINFSEMTTLSKLLSVINSFDAMPKRVISNLSNSSNQSFKNNAFSSLRPKLLCPYCKKRGFERFHSERDCFTKFRDQRNSNSPIDRNPGKAINALEVDDLLNEIREIQKNE